MSASRPATLLAAARRHGVQALLLTDPLSVRWAAGVRDARWALVADGESLVMPYALAWSAMRQDARAPWRVLAPATPGSASLSRCLARSGITRLGYESDMLPWAAAERLKRDLDGRCLLVPTEHLLASARRVKSASERAVIRRAAVLASEAGAALPWMLRPGITEHEAAAKLDQRMRAAGADGPAFDTIMLFGSRSALPHGIPGGRRLRPGDLVLVDWGAKLDGYHSDMTRVWVCGRPTGGQRAAYRAVWKAKAHAAAKVRAGLREEESDLAARAALGHRAKTFMHSLGHGVGLAIHEEPRLARGMHGRLRAGEVITVEPGIYVNGWGGIRLEDTYVVTARAAISLTGTPAPELPSLAR